MILEDLLGLLSQVQVAVLVTGASWRTNATDTLQIKHPGQMLQKYAMQREELWLPFIQRRKISLFINSALALKKISGLEQMTMTKTDLGCGQMEEIWNSPTGLL